MPTDARSPPNHKPHNALPESLIAPVPRGTAIPRIIHQVYFPGKPPQIIAENINKIRSLNPAWEHRLYDDIAMEEFIRSNYDTWALADYLSITEKYGAAKADLFRYLLMYRTGGVYLDIKSSMEKPLDDVLRADDVYLLSRWRNAEGEPYEGWGMHNQLKTIGGNEFQQWHIIACTGHPFLAAVIERVHSNLIQYNPLIHDTGRRGVLRITGPIAYTQAISPLLDCEKFRLTDSENELCFTYSIFGAAGSRAHKTIFKFHYTELREPITALKGLKKLAWLILGPIQNQVIERFRTMIDAVSRRLMSRPVRRG